MHRFVDWEERLRAYLASVRLRQFEWGAHDCCLHAAAAVIAMTGEDPMAEFRGRYSTPIGSMRALRRYGAGTLRDTMTAKFGEPVSRALAMRGDIVMAGEALGVSLGAVAAMVGREEEREGLLSLPRAAWECAWRIPF